MGDKAELNGIVERTTSKVEELKKGNEAIDKARKLPLQKEEEVKLVAQKLDNTKKITDNTKIINDSTKKIDDITKKMNDNHKAFTGGEKLLSAERKMQKKQDYFQILQAVSLLTGAIDPDIAQQTSKKITITIEQPERGDKYILRDSKGQQNGVSNTRRELEKMAKDMDKQISVLGDAQDIAEERRKADRERNERLDNLRKKQEEKKGYERD